jgi:hypothetical protein
MNYYNPTFEEHEEQLKKRRELYDTQFTQKQLELSTYWNRFDYTGDRDILIRSTWNWELLYKVNQAKGIRG